MNHQGHPQTTEQARYDFMSHFQDPVTPGRSRRSTVDLLRRCDCCCQSGGAGVRGSQGGVIRELVEQKDATVRRVGA